jgi:hypothetical protein
VREFELTTERESLECDIAALRSRSSRPRGFVEGFVVGTLILALSLLCFMGWVLVPIAHVE